MLYYSTSFGMTFALVSKIYNFSYPTEIYNIHDQIVSFSDFLITFLIFLSSRHKASNGVILLDIFQGGDFANFGYLAIPSSILVHVLHVFYLYLIFLYFFMKQFIYNECIFFIKLHVSVDFLNFIPESTYDVVTS